MNLSKKSIGQLELFSIYGYIWENQTCSKPPTRVFYYPQLWFPISTNSTAQGGGGSAEIPGSLVFPPNPCGTGATTMKSQPSRAITAWMRRQIPRQKGLWSMAISGTDLLEVPTAYHVKGLRGMSGDMPPKYSLYMVRYLNFRILRCWSCLTCFILWGYSSIRSPYCPSQSVAWSIRIYWKWTWIPLDKCGSPIYAPNGSDYSTPTQLIGTSLGNIYA